MTPETMAPPSGTLCGYKVENGIAFFELCDPPANTYTTGTKGSYGITLLDRDNEPAAGVPVTFAVGTTAGATGVTKTTNSKGCARPSSSRRSSTPSSSDSWSSGSNGDAGDRAPACPPHLGRRYDSLFEATRES